MFFIPFPPEENVCIIFLPVTKGLQARQSNRDDHFVVSLVTKLNWMSISSKSVPSSLLLLHIRLLRVLSLQQKWTLAIVNKRNVLEEYQGFLESAWNWRAGFGVRAFSELRPTISTSGFLKDISEDSLPFLDKLLSCLKPFHDSPLSLV